MKKLYLVWNSKMNECVGFLDKDDAIWAANGGQHPRTWLPTVGDRFRDTYAEDEFGEANQVLPLTEIEIE